MRIFDFRFSIFDFYPLSLARFDRPLAQILAELSCLRKCVAPSPELILTLSSSPKPTKPPISPPYSSIASKLGYAESEVPKGFLADASRASGLSG